MMKVCRLIPAIIALAILVGGPFGLGRMCDTDPRGGLICYCGCLERGGNCTMISCEGCCGGHTGSVTDHRSPEMTLEPFPENITLLIAYGDREASGLPENVYLEVPDKPPKYV